METEKVKGLIFKGPKRKDKKKKKYYYQLFFHSAIGSHFRFYFYNIYVYFSWQQYVRCSMLEKTSGLWSKFLTLTGPQFPHL